MRKIQQKFLYGKITFEQQLTMSHLLKRTKKSCLKILRKISSSKPLFAKKIDSEIDDATNNNNNSYNKNNNSQKNNHNSNNNNNNNKNSQKANNQDNTKSEDYSTNIAKSPIAIEKVNHDFEQSTKSLPSTTITTYPQDENQQEKIPSPKKIEKGKSNQKSFDFEEESPNNTILHKLTARLFLTADGYDFHRLKHLRSDTGSEVIQFDTMDTTDFITTEENIIFEKVKYKNDIRYLRHTPSNSSLDNYKHASFATTPEYPYECGIDFGLEPDWLPSEIDDEEKCPAASNQFTNYGYQAPKETFMPIVNMSLGSKLNGNRQNVVISQEFDKNKKLMPVVKWDINGNSLDDDDDLLPHEYLEDFDKRLSKRLAAVQQFQTAVDDNESSESSLRSSSTTLETWVDEDLIVESSLINNFDLTLRENSCLTKA